MFALFLRFYPPIQSWCTSLSWVTYQAESCFVFLVPRRPRNHFLPGTYLALTIYTSSPNTHRWVFAKTHANADAASEMALPKQYKISKNLWNLCFRKIGNRAALEHPIFLKTVKKRWRTSSLRAVAESWFSRARIASAAIWATAGATGKKWLVLPYIEIAVTLRIMGVIKNPGLWVSISWCLWICDILRYD